VVVNAFRSIRDETPFRVKWIKLITEPKTMRLGHGPGITEAMMTEGPMNVDFQKMAALADRLIKSFENARSVHITAPGGTDLVVAIEGRAFCTDTRITNEQAGNLPCGEIWCAPVETGADGMLVIDGCIGDVGVMEKPLRIEIAGGKIATLECDDEDVLAEIERLTAIDAEARIIGELGIGLNAGAKLTGNLLEDEKAFRTAHIAFGCNDDMPGGQNHSQTHRDFLFHKPTFDVEFTDGSRKVLIRDGDFQVD
jgi:leucyl aminopeptidase (aminopeptidase T)